jgi:hypothetical protein
MPFNFTGLSGNINTIVWNYDKTDVMDPEFNTTVHTLTIIGADEAGNYNKPGHHRLSSSVYDETTFCENARQIQNLPLINVLDVHSIFPNLEWLSLYQVNINKLLLPDTLTGWSSTDCHIETFDLPPSLYWITMICCYGCWSKLASKLSSIISLKRIQLRGDYCNEFEIPNGLLSLHISACKFNKLVNECRLYNIHLVTITECECPYEEHVVNTRLFSYPSNSIQINKKYPTQYSRYISNARDMIASIIRTNNRINAENNTHILVSLRNKSFITSDERNINKANLLGSNPLRRAMEYITDM